MGRYSIKRSRPNRRMSVMAAAAVLAAPLLLGTSAVADGQAVGPPRQCERHADVLRGGPNQGLQRVDLELRELQTADEENGEWLRRRPNAATP